MVRCNHQHAARVPRGVAILPDQPVDRSEEAFRHAVVAIEVSLRDRRLPRRHIRCEEVADGVGRLEIHDREIRTVPPDPVERQVAVHLRFDQHAPQRAHRLGVRIVGIGDLAVLGLAQPREVLA
jgi:hypothetical protein